MEKLVNYETIMVFDVANGEDAVKALSEKFTTLISEHGTIDSVEEWGKRRLAYEIDKKREGYYLLVNFTSSPTFLKELDRVFNITDGIMRTLVVRKDSK